MSVNETPEVVETVKSSKLSKIKSAAAAGAFWGLPAIALGGSIYASVKMTKMQLDTAKLNNETAKINKP